MDWFAWGGSVFERLSSKILIVDCWSCQTELIWGGDHNGEDYGDENYGIVSNLSCPNCEAFVLVYHDKLDEADR